MGEGNDARSGAASKVWGRAFMMAVEGRPAILTAPGIGAVTSLVPWILAVTFETIDMRGELALLFPKCLSWWRTQIFDLLSTQAFFSFAPSWVVVRGPLCRMDMQDNTGGRSPWSSVYKVRDKSCSNCCMGEEMLHVVLLLLSFQFLSPQLDALLFDGCETQVLLPQGVDVSSNSCISQMQKSVIYNDSVRGGGVENGKISVARGVPIEIGMREGVSMQGSAINGSILGASPLEHHSVSHGQVPDVPSNFFFPVLVDKDEGIVLGVARVILEPSFLRMNAFFLITDRYVRGHGHSFQECLGSLFFDEVRFDVISKGGDVCEVSDVIEFFVSDGEGN